MYWRKCDGCDGWMEAEKEFGDLYCSPECEELVKAGLLDYEEEEADIIASLSNEGSLD